MTETNACPKCHAELPADSPGGLCPRCLLLAGMDDSNEPQVPEHGSAYAVTTPQPGGFVPPAAEELVPLFPQLEILELIGHGGMGAVYKARQTKLDRLVALKIIRPESADDPAFAERFNREARTLARLSHPAIIAVHDFGEVQSSHHAPRDEAPAHPATDGEQNAQRQPVGAHHAERDGHNERTLYYFVMEYVDGVNLRQLMADGKLPAEQALAIVPQVCDALQFAHDEGIVHRDIKPENILVDARGRVKIADFGLARLASRSDQDVTLTGTYQVMGTPRYMAPEQMEHSHAVDHRADIYSLGVVFYEMLTGQVPAGHFDPPSKRAGVDGRLDDVVLRALARDPERRYQQASEISSHVNAIRGVTAETYITPVPVAQQPPGPSTIVERAASRIIGGIRHGGMLRSLTHPAGPGIVAILMCIGGMATIFVPWGFNRGDGSEIYAYDNSWGLLSGIVFFALGLTMFAASPTDRRPRWRPWALLLSGAVLLGLVLLFRGNVMKSGDIVPDGSYFTAFGFSIGLMLVGAWDVRCLLSQLTDPNAANASSPDPVDDEYPSSIGGHDWVTLTKEQVEADDLPDVCIVCGRPTQERLNKDFSYQSDVAGVFTVIGIFCGILPGIIIAKLTEREQRIACPVCPRHRNHWSRFAWWASTGWQIPIVLGALCGLIAWLVIPWVTDLQVVFGAIAGAAVGLIIYLVRLIRMALRRVDAEEITDRTIRLRRVSAAFAKEAGGRTPPATSGEDESKASDEPHASRKAILGACWAGLFLLTLSVAIPMVLSGLGSRPTETDLAAMAGRGTMTWSLLLRVLIVLPGALAPVGTTILGWVAIHDIRRSEGRLTGLPLAIADALAFPLLLINGVMFGLFLYFFYAGIEMNIAMSVFLAAGQTALIGGWLSSDIVKRVWRAVGPAGDESEVEEQEEGDSFPGRELAVMLAIVLPLFALIGFAMPHTGSSWALAGLALPWVVLGMCGGYNSNKREESAANVSAILSLLISIGLIACGVALADSLWPLLAVLAGIAGALGGIFVGAACREDEEEDGTESAERDADAEPAEAATDEEVNENEASRALEWPAGLMLLLSIKVCFTLVTEGSEALLAAMRGESVTLDPSFWFTLPAPIVLLGSLMMFAEIAYPLAIAACILCMPLGLTFGIPFLRILPVVLGAWGLLVLLTDARSLFCSEDRPSKSDDDTDGDPRPAAGSDLPGSVNPATGWMRSTLKVVLLSAFVGCLVQFFTYRDRQDTSQQSEAATSTLRIIEFGRSTPWLSVTKGPEGMEIRRWHFNPLASSALLMLVGIAVYVTFWRMMSTDVAAGGRRLPWVGAPPMIVLGCTVGALIAVGWAMDPWSLDRLRERGITGAQTHEVTVKGTHAETDLGLHEACRLGDSSRVKERLDAGASVHDRDAEGRTPLMVAAAHGHASLCQALLLLGANAGDQDLQGRTALMHAVVYSREEVIRAFFAIEYRSRMMEASKQLRSLNLDWKLLEDVDLSRIGSIGIATETQDHNGETALMKAAAYGDEVCVKALLGGTYVVGVDMRDNKGRSALMHAVTNRQTSLIRSMANAAYDRVAMWSPEGLGEMNRFNNSMLGTFSMFDVESLRIADNDGKTAYELAQEQGSTEIAELLRKFLELVIARETAAIELGGEGVRWCYRDRAHAYQALGDREQAEADLIKTGMPVSETQE